MGKLAEAYVEIRGEDAHLASTLNHSKGLLSGFVGQARGMLGGLAAAASAAAIGGVGAAMLQTALKAADLGESLDKVKNAFGKAAAAKLIAETDTLADRYGVVRREALDAASAFGLMGRAAGLSRDQSAGLGSDFVRLGIDLASFHNLSNAEAFEKLRSGLAGESEPLRPLGILLSEDAVKAEALASGLVKVKRELTDQEKVLARASLIRKQMEAQGSVGDRERTKDSIANQWKQMQGDLENFQTKLGESLLSPLGEAIKLARELGAEFEKTFGSEPVAAFGEDLKAVLTALRMQTEEGSEGYLGLAVKSAMDPKGLYKRLWEGITGTGPPPGPHAGETRQEQADRLAGVKKGAPGETGQEKAERRGRGIALTPAERRADQVERVLAERAAQMARHFERNGGIDERLMDQSRRKFADLLGKAHDNPALVAAAGPLLHSVLSRGLLNGSVSFLNDLHPKPEEREKPRLAASSFMSGEDFFRFAQTEVFNAEAQERKKQTEEQIKATAELQQIKTGIQDLVKKAGERVGAILRGRS